MGDDYTPVIRKIQEVPTFDGAGRPFQSTRVEYMIGIHGPFTETVATMDFSAPKIQGLMQAKADVLRALGATSQQ